MSTITTNALAAYNKAAGLSGTPGISGEEPSNGTADFASMVQDALGKAVEVGKEAEVKSAKNISGKGELVDVVTALTAAETTLDTIVAVRDRVIAAYQDISRMPI
ncbi:MAG: flagellar hook-basal body complex protein FliE [Alphaproteobacteria bacterium]